MDDAKLIQKNSVVMRSYLAEASYLFHGGGENAFRRCRDERWKGHEGVIGSGWMYTVG